MGTPLDLSLLMSAAPADIGGYSQGVYGGGGGGGMASAIMGGASILGPILSYFGQKSQANAQQKMNELQMAEQESALNPFRGVLAQGGALQKLDRSMNTTPRSVVQNPNGYSGIQGGQYTMSPELMNWLSKIRADVASGQGRNPLISPQARVGVMDLNTNQHMVPRTGVKDGSWR